MLIAIIILIVLAFGIDYARNKFNDYNKKLYSLQKQIDKLKKEEK